MNTSQTHECRNGTLAPKILFWEYLFQIFYIGSLQCMYPCCPHPKRTSPSYSFNCKGSIVYRVPQFLCCRMIWVPPPPFPCEMASLPSVFLLPVRIACLHSLAGEGAGGPKSYEQHSTETLVLYMKDSLYAFNTPSTVHLLHCN
jgi:hypothetical protein